jgi:hypothetical protein
MSTSRQGLGAVVLDEKIYAIGGGGASGSLSSCEVYDPAIGAWRSMPDMSTPRYYFEAVVLDGKIYAIGASSSCEVYDPAVGAWTSLPDMSTARIYFQAAVLDGKIYAIGGCGDSSCEVYALSFACYMELPAYTTRRMLLTSNWSGAPGPQVDFRASLFMARSVVRDYPDFAVSRIIGAAKGPTVTVKSATSTVEITIDPLPDGTSYPRGWPLCEVLAFSIHPIRYGCDLRRAVLSSSGTGDEATQIVAARLWLDADGSGTITPDDLEISNTQNYTQDDGTIQFDVGPAVARVPADATGHFLLTYDFTVTPGDPAYFTAHIDDLVADVLPYADHQFTEILGQRTGPQIKMRSEVITPTATSTATPTSASTDTPTITDTPTNTPTDAPTDTPTDTATDVPTITDTPTPTKIPTLTPTGTFTQTTTASLTPTNADTESPTPTEPLPTLTPTETNTPSGTPTPTESPVVVLFQEDFESYAAGEQPGNDWIPYGSASSSPSSSVVVSDTAHGDLQSLKIAGSTGCWEGLFEHAVSFTEVFTMDYWTMAGGEYNGGCHVRESGIVFERLPFAGAICSSDCAVGVLFAADGTIRLASPEAATDPAPIGIEIGTYAPLTWYHVTIVVNVPEKRIKASVDGSAPVEMAMDNTFMPSYFALLSGDGVSWFDDIYVYPGDTLPETSTPTSTPTDTPTYGPTDTPTDAATPTPTQDLPPKAPVNLKASSGGDSIALQWDANGEEDLLGYFVYRANSEGGYYDVLNETPFSAPGYVDPGLIVGSRYCYKVTAVDTAGQESLPAGPACASVGQLRVWTPDVFGRPGDLIRIPVNISNAYGITDNGLNIEVDTRTCVAGGLLSFVTWERTGLTPNYLFDSYEPNPGDVRLITISTTGFPLAGEGHLVDLYYRVSEEAQEGQSCAFSFKQDGLGVRLYTLDQNGLPVRLDVDYSDTSEFEVTGKYTLGDIFPLCQDGGPDGVVDAGDVLLALAISVGRIDASVCPHLLDAGDVNGDGVIDSADVILIARISVGKPVNPPQSDKAIVAYKEALAQAPSEYNVRVGQAGLTKDGTCEVAISVDNAAGISGADIQLNFNPSGVQPVSLEPGNLAHDFRLESNMDMSSKGVVRLAIARPDNLTSGGGTLAILRFHAVGSAGSWSPLVLAKVKLSRQYGEDVSWETPVKVTNGSIVLCPPYDINRDGTTDKLDLWMFGRQWQKPFGGTDLLEFFRER